MRTRAFVMGSVGMAATLLMASFSWAGGGIAHRQTKQSQSISGGLRSGAITQREFKTLGGEQWRIKQGVEAARADRRFNVRERRRIHKVQDEASQHIYRAKHNQARYSRESPYGHRSFQHKPRYQDGPINYWHGPTYYGYHFMGRYSEPHYSFVWSIGW